MSLNEKIQTTFVRSADIPGNLLSIMDQLATNF